MNEKISFYSIHSKSDIYKRAQYYSMPIWSFILSSILVDKFIECVPIDKINIDEIYISTSITQISDCDYEIIKEEKSALEIVYQNLNCFAVSCTVGVLDSFLKNLKININKRRTTEKIRESISHDIVKNVCLKRNLLHRAIFDKKTNLVKFLLEQPNIKVNIEQVEKTVTRKMNKEQIKIFEETPLHIAVKKCQSEYFIFKFDTEIIELLMKNPSIDPFIQDSDGKTPMDLAICSEIKDFLTKNIK